MAAEDPKIVSEYEPPEIFEIGQVEDLTFGALSSGEMDAHFMFHSPSPHPS